MNKKNSGDRSPEQLREHYEIEKKLADKLKQSTKEERVSLYSSLYDELFKRVPHHPQLVRKNVSGKDEIVLGRRMQFLHKFLHANLNFVEVGAGDCSLSFAVARHVKNVYAVEVSSEITKDLVFPANCHLIISDGSTIPLPPGSADLVYSNQLMEHIHPDDAYEQLTSIYTILTTDGYYLCFTPNRLNGPHDISKYFDREAQGFHIKEYTNRELVAFFKAVGFRKIKAYVGVRGMYAVFPLSIIQLGERVLESLPYSIQKTLARSLPFRFILGIRIVAIK